MFVQPDRTVADDGRVQPGIGDVQAVHVGEDVVGVVVAHALIDDRQLGAHGQTVGLVLGGVVGRLLVAVERVFPSTVAVRPAQTIDTPRQNS